MPMSSVYKFSLSGALTLLLDLRSGSTGEEYAVELGDVDSGDTAEEQAAGRTSATSATETSSGTPSFRN